MKHAPTFIGIDPGVNGAIARWMPATNALVIEDMPTLMLHRSGSKKRTIDVVALAGILRRMCDVLTGIDLAVIEQVSTRPGQGIGTALSTGWNGGVAYGALVAQMVPTKVVTPRVWKQEMQVKADKDEVRHIASMMMPTHAERWALASTTAAREAALIARFAERAYNASELKL